MTTKLYSSAMRGFTALEAVPGRLVSILDECLRTGAGSVTAVSVTVSGGIATATLNVGESFTPGATILVSGSSTTGINGEAKVITATNTSCTWATTAADGTASGTISIKVAGAGWAKPFSTSEKACFQSQHEDATGCILRVDDTGTTTARVVGYTSMSDVDTGDGPFPTSAQQSGGLYWPKAHNSAGTRSWFLVADERTFYLYVLPTTGTNTGSLLGFGDFISDNPDDWACFLAGHASALYTGGAGCLSAVGTAVAATLALPKPASGSGTSTLAYLLAPFRSSGVSGSATGSLLSTWPNVAHGDTVLTEAFVVASDGLRGRLPGLRHTPSALGAQPPMDATTFPSHIVARTNPGAAGVALVSTEDWR